ncbi:SPOR domain-containing protein [Thermaurantiacus sp.]
MARTPSPRQEAARGREPWLEEADPELAEATLIGRKTLWTLLGALLLLIAIVVAGLLLVTRKADGPGDIPAADKVPLVPSPGPWRVPAEGPGIEGTPVEGQGQLMFPAGEGQAPDGRIDPDRLPETPVPLPPREPAGGPPTDLLGQSEAANLPAPEPQEIPPRRPEPPPAPALKPAPPVPTSQPAPPAPADSGSFAMVQLGAFSSEAAARRAFRDLAARHPELRGLRPELSRTNPGEDRTLWRLRVMLDAGVEPRSFCDRLRVAGDACAPVR